MNAVDPQSLSRIAYRVLLDAEDAGEITVALSREVSRASARQAMLARAMRKDFILDVASELTLT